MTIVLFRVHSEFRFDSSHDFHAYLLILPSLTYGSPVMFAFVAFNHYPCKVKTFSCLFSNRKTTSTTNVSTYFDQSLIWRWEEKLEKKSSTFLPPGCRHPSIDFPLDNTFYSTKQINFYIKKCNARDSTRTLNEDNQVN